MTASAKLGAHLLGRRLYETMVYWETADRDPSASAVTLDFARIWQALPKIVFSKTLESVQGNARLVSGNVVDEARAAARRSRGAMWRWAVPASRPS